MRKPHSLKIGVSGVRGIVGDSLTPQLVTTSEEDIITLDGIEINHPDKWLHIRPSNTEPILRIVAKGRTKAAALDLIAAVRKDIEDILGEQ